MAVWCDFPTLPKRPRPRAKQLSYPPRRSYGRGAGVGRGRLRGGGLGHGTATATESTRQPSPAMLLSLPIRQRNIRLLPKGIARL